MSIIYAVDDIGFKFIYLKKENFPNNSFCFEGMFELI